MGSFSEAVFAFRFRRDTPDAVLAAVSALEQPPRDDFPESAPALPEPVREPVEGWIPDWRHAGGPPDPFEAEQWRHDWAPWLGVDMARGRVTYATLAWTGSHWKLTCRLAFKGWATLIHEFLEWFGPFIDTCEMERPLLIGYIDDEQEPRPYLLWAHDGRLVMEDLNRSDGEVSVAS